MKEINTRSYMLTLWVKDITNEDFYNWVFNGPISSKINKVCIGAVETTENENLHYHVYIKFYNPIRLLTLKKYISIESTHIEKVNTNINECFKYCSKNGIYYTNIVEEDLKTDVESDVYSDLTSDIFDSNFTLIEICRKYGKIAVLHFNNIKSIISLRDEEKLRDNLYAQFDESFYNSF